MADVSVILPCRNEENAVGICIKKIRHVFREMGIDGEIIVSDSSSDRSADIAEGMGARVIKHDKAGYGNAYLQAIPEAEGRHIVMGDADNTYDFLEMPALLEKLKDCDFVMGSRMKGDIRPGAMRPLHRYVGNPLLSFLFNILYGTNISDTHCGFRAITKESLRSLELSCGGMEFALEMITEAKRKGLRIGEVPITYHPRKGASKLNSFRDGWRHIRFMLVNL